jgi:hypothetical protein
MTQDVCDACWGSGDSQRLWTDLRKLSAIRSDWEADQCMRWLASRCGASLSTFRPLLRALAAVVAKEARRRTLPPGLSDQLFWYRNAAESIADVMTSMCDASERAEERKKGG